MTTPPKPRSRFYRLRSLFAFVVILVGFDLLILANRAVWQAHSPDGYTERVEGCARHRRDLVFVGGSTVAEGINPAAVGPIAWHGRTLTDHYSVGLSGGTTSDIYFGTLHSCPSPPAVLVYGITASDINDSRHEPHGPHSLMTWNDVRDWRNTRPDAAEWVTRHYLRGRAEGVWAAYHYRHGIRMWAAITADRLMPGCCPEAVAEANRHTQTAAWLRDGSGYSPTQWFAHRRYDHMKMSGWEQPHFEYLDRYRTGSHLKYLHRLADWCDAHGTRLILIDMPTTADLEQRHSAEFNEYRTRLAEIERGRDLTVLRASRDQTGLGDEHFADLIHLNLSGCERLSSWVKLELARLGRAVEDTPKVVGTRVARVGGRP